MAPSSLWIVDFGSQYTQLIARKSRQLGLHSEILTCQEARERLSADRLPAALVLSGGPDSVFQDGEDYGIFFSHRELPVLGICYGMQVMAAHFGGSVRRGERGEYGPAKVQAEAKLEWEGCPGEFKVWMGHCDRVARLPVGFEVALRSENGLVAALASTERPLLGLQFHPEVDHTDYGENVLRHFFFKVAGLTKDWNTSSMLQEAQGALATAGQAGVLCAFSGGVDSLVAASLAHRGLGENLRCFFVDNGLLRPQDLAHIRLLRQRTDLPIEIIDAAEKFLAPLAGVGDPEEKRKIIGRTFVEVFENQVRDYEESHGIRFEYLLQGTLYPDLIESLSPHGEGGKSATIKSHHNVGGLPERMSLKLIEPLRHLFKDEVRAIGRELGLASEWLGRHPFPGPGIGVRVLGEVTREGVAKVQQSDQILLEELDKRNLYDSFAQALTVLLPVNTVGIKGDGRAFQQVICLRLVCTRDFMTAEAARPPWEFLHTVCSRIVGEVAGITRVVYDITPKPPGTIEWE